MKKEIILVDNSSCSNVSYTKLIIRNSRYGSVLVNRGQRYGDNPRLARAWLERALTEKELKELKRRVKNIKESYEVFMEALEFIKTVMKTSEIQFL